MDALLRRERLNVDTRNIAIPVSVLWICAIALLACPKELSETFEESNREMEAHRVGGPKVAAAEKSKPPKFAESAAAARKPKEDLTGRPLPPGSPEAKLFSEIVSRLGCADPVCSQRILTRIRQSRATFAPAFDKLLDGQQADRVTTEVVKIVGILRIKQSIKALGEVAVNKPGNIRHEAIWSLGSIGSKEAVIQLRRLSRLGLDIPTREKVCRAYGSLKSKETINDVVDLIRSGSSRVQVSCALALGLIKSDLGVPHLVALLERSPQDVKQAAKRALRAIGSQRALQALRDVAEGNP